MFGGEPSNGIKAMERGGGIAQDKHKRACQYGRGKSHRDSSPSSKQMALPISADTHCVAEVHDSNTCGVHVISMRDPVNAALL